jgi:hypothetical protein
VAVETIGWPVAPLTTATSTTISWLSVVIAVPSPVTTSS